MRMPLRPVVPNDKKYDELFDRFEFLLGAVLADLDEHRDGQGSIPSGYVGRYGYRRHWDHPDPLAWGKKELERSQASPLLGAGFFGNDETRLKGALAVMEGWLSRFRWV